MRAALLLLVGGCHWAFGISEVEPDAAISIDAATHGRWRQAGVGQAHACALDDTQTVSCWGNGGHGATGLDQPTPHPQALAGTWTQLAVGSRHTCAINTDRNTYCWGADEEGEVDGTGSTQNVTVPKVVPLPPAAPALTELSAGGHATCGLGDGRLFCWGSVLITAMNTTAPTEITGATWAQVSVGWSHACAVDTNHDAWCWGANDAGQLGATTPVDSPPLVVLHGVASISAGLAATCAVLMTGEVDCWGNSSVTGTQLTAPTQLLRDNDWTGVAVGTGVGCATRGGNAFCWGDVAHGGLGDGHWTEHLLGTAATMIGPADQVSLALGTSGEESGCALADGNLACWGDNRGGQLGFPAALHAAPVMVPNPGGIKWVGLAVGTSHTCAFDEGHAPFCWGADDAGQSSGTPHADRTEVVEMLMAAPADQLVAGTDFTCAHHATALTCWGDNHQGALANADQSAHVAISSVAGSILLPPTSGRAACYTDGADYNCWGWWGGAAHAAPGKIAGDAGTIVQPTFVGFGESSSCFLGSPAQRVCFGYDYFDEFGDNMASSTNASRAPTRIFDGLSWKRLALSGEHACGIDTGAYVYCWGTNYWFESADEVTSVEIVALPRLVGDSAGAIHASLIALGPTFSCAANSDHQTIQCWGQNTTGTLGTSPETIRLTATPTVVPGLPPTVTYADLGAGATHACALTNTGQVWCWGLSDRGQVGDGSRGSATPVAIVHP